ncbi:MAG: S8 family serine peptidase [Calditrichaceae bacterium]|nr:S8 family serine peptidase [Calditrichaceae bacterium]
MKKSVLFILMLIYPILSQQISPLVPHSNTVKQHQTGGYISPFLLDLITEMNSNHQFAQQHLNQFSKAELKKLFYSIDLNNRIFVRIKCSNDIQQILGELKQINSEIVAQNESLALIDCWLPAHQIESAALIPGIRNISECERGHVRSGSVTSEGDTLHKTNIIRQYLGADGTGIRVGVISDGVNDIASSQSTGDLPSIVNVIDNSEGGNEGTAMLEIVHDLAPGAELYFSEGIETATEFINSVNDLAASGCDVIVDDIGYFTEPYFEEGPIASAVRNAIDNYGIVYASSAGNSQDEHYEGDYSPVTPSPAITGISEAHNFGGSDYGQQITLSAGQSFYIFLQWNEPYGSVTSEYELHLVNQAMTTDYGIPSYQLDPNDPFVYLGVNASAGSYNIVIERVSGPNRRVELTYNFGGYATVDQFNTLPGSINGQPAVTDVIATGAVRFDSPSLIEYFSSIGPSRIYSYPSYTYEARNKPDVVAVDGNIITGAGGFGQEYPSGSGDIRFFGTSASAPHVAACAAVLWSAYPDLTNDEVRQRILNNAVDLGTAGFDNIYGHGRVDMQQGSSSPQFTITGINGGSNSMMSAGITPGDNLAEISGYTFTADQSPYKVYLDQIEFSIAGTVDGSDINSFSLYADLNDDEIITQSVDSMLGQAPFSSTVQFNNIGYSFDISGINLILTADVDLNANAENTISVSLNSADDVTAYFETHPFSTNFPFYAEDISLPVELLAFNVNTTNNQAEISWVTASEINVSHYELYRNDGFNETMIEKIEAAGNSSQQENYFFVDENLKAGCEYTYILYNVELSGYKEKIADERIKLLDINNIVLYPNYPNPFNPSTTIKYQIPISSQVSIKIYDILGCEIKTLVNEVKSAGVYTAKWNGKNIHEEQVGHGIYYYQLKTSNGFIETKKMMLIK